MAIDLTTEIVARWPDAEPAHARMLADAGITIVLTPGPPPEPFAKACAATRVRALPDSEIAFASLTAAEQAAPDSPIAVNTGLWPGVRGAGARKGPDEIASASREPWLDANGFWIGYLRALFPRRPAVLGYPAPAAGKMVPYTTLELALAEAWMTGGNYILDVDERYRGALLKGDAKALAAWKELGRTAAWLKQNRRLFGRPVMPVVCLLVDKSEASAEIANMMYRRNASPELCAVNRPPAYSPKRLAMVAVELEQLGDAERGRILDHARAGTTVVTNRMKPAADWKKLKSQEDRDFYGLGKGQVVVYRDSIDDPSEFALDVIDIITHKQRAIRLWNALAVIPLATQGEAGGALLHLVNYGSPLDIDFPARVRGDYTKAELLRPEAAPLPLKTAKRGPSTEVVVPELRRVATVRLS